MAGLSTTERKRAITRSTATTESVPVSEGRRLERSGSTPDQSNVLDRSPSDDLPKYLISADEVLAKDLKDPAFRALWVREAPARAVALAVLHYRVQHGLTQTALARRLGMRQPAIARLEIGEHTPSIDTLVRLSEALDIEFLIDIKPSAKRSRWVSRRAEQARVTEKVDTASGGEVFVAAG